jgi:TonB family protein
MNFRPSLVALGLAATSFAAGCGPTAVTDPPATLPPATAAQQPQESYLAMLTVHTSETVPVYAAPSRSAALVSTLGTGARIRLLERQPEWFLVQTPSGVRGYVEPASLVTPTCTADRPAPLIVEEPLFRFRADPPHGTVVIEAEYTAEGVLINSRILQNSIGDPEFERIALEDLRGLRFLPPTSRCKPLPFFYTFTRHF